MEKEVDRYSAEVIGGIGLYPIGAYGWCWEEENMNNDLQIGDRVIHADRQDERNVVLSEPSSGIGPMLIRYTLRFDGKQ